MNGYMRKCYKNDIYLPSLEMNQKVIIITMCTCKDIALKAIKSKVNLNWHVLKTLSTV